MASRRVLHDPFFKRAKAEGYAARSAYKLKGIQERYRVLRPGDKVCDLGCAPGSWLQVAAELVGPSGLVVGIDLTPVTIALPENARAAVADAFRVTPAELLGLAGAPDPGRDRFDCVLSDMAPSTVGHGDDLRSVTLCRRVLEVLPTLLRHGGNLVMKVLEGGEYPALLRETHGLFQFVKGYRPEATREVSREIFIVAERFRAPAPMPEPTPEPVPLAAVVAAPAPALPKAAKAAKATKAAAGRVKKPARPAAKKAAATKAGPVRAKPARRRGKA